MKQKILIQDFMCECRKITSDDVSELIYNYLKLRHPRTRTNYISVDDALLISEKLVDESNAHELDLKSFRNGVTKLIDGNNQKLKYDGGIMYATCQYIKRD